jgi:hypothetical protein
MRGLVLLLLVAGCNRSADRYRSVDDGFAMARLAGWTDSREKGSIVFRGPEGIGLDKNTVVVRAVPLERVKQHARDQHGLARATAAILAGLPGSEVSKATDVKLDDLAGSRFEVSFEPSGKERPYRRTQITLLGDRHVFHLMHTAPAEVFDQTAAEFEQAVASFEEI